MARLGDVFESQIAGEWGSECAENENGTKVLRTTNFTQEGRINYADVVIRSINQSKVEKKRLHYGDIILEKSGGTEKTPVGRVVFCDEAVEDSIYLCNNFTQAMRVNQAIAIPRYVFYFMWNLHSSGKTDLLQNKTTGIRNLQVKSYSNENCPLPPLEEQHKIAAVLDKVSDLIAKRRQQLNKLDELVKSRFVEMFGGIHDSKIYPYKLVKDLTEVISGGTPSRDINEYWEGGTIPWVKTTELQNSIVTEVEEHITEEGLNNSSAKIVPSGTVLIAMYGQGKTRGMTAYLGIEACTNQACACILPSNKINQTFLWLFFVLSYDNLRDMAKGGNQPNLNGNIIKNYPVLYPPMELQEQFAAFVTQTDKSKLAVQKSLDKLELLKKSLMQKYFG
jgi:restriction endonuclease S subunit